METEIEIEEGVEEEEMIEVVTDTIKDLKDKMYAIIVVPKVIGPTNVNKETGETNATDVENPVISRKTVLCPDPLLEKEEVTKIEIEEEKDTLAPEADPAQAHLVLVDLEAEAEIKKENILMIDLEEEKEALPVDPVQDLRDPLLQETPDLNLNPNLNLEKIVTNPNPGPDLTPEDQEDLVNLLEDQPPNLNLNPDLNPDLDLDLTLNDLDTNKNKNTINNKYDIFQFEV